MSPEAPEAKDSGRAAQGSRREPGTAGLPAESAGSDARDAGGRAGAAEGGAAQDSGREAEAAGHAGKEAGREMNGVSREARVSGSEANGVGVRRGTAEPEGDVPDPEAQAEVTVRDAISAPDAEGVPRRVTRRFPLFTRDTARPEGGGRAAPGDAPAPARQWPILVVLAVVALGLLLTALDAFRIGTLLIGVALVAGAVLRWVLPDVGMLAVRSRFTDIVTYGGLGVVIVLLAMMVQPHPWLQIPFLKDTLHYTVSSS